MAVTRLSDVVVPETFTSYTVQNTMEKTALLSSGAIVRNSAIDAQLKRGGETFNVPAWNDLGNAEADRSNDDPEVFSTPQKITAFKQRVRKSFLHQSWSSMQFAGELAGSDPLAALQGRVTDYWSRQLQRRVVATLQGILADNLNNDASDMIVDISAMAAEAANFNASAVIDAAATLGDAMDSLSAIFMHSHVYTRALKNDNIEFVTVPSMGKPIPTYRGMVVIVDDGLPNDGTKFTTILAGSGALSYGMTAPNVAKGTEIESVPAAGNGGGMEVLHSRNNCAVHPSGFDWIEGTLADESPSIADLRDGSHWNRVVERKAIPLAFLLSK